MNPPARPHGAEPLIGPLIPAAVARPRPIPPPLSGLPAQIPPTDPDDMLLHMARVDRSGRVCVRGLLRALGWRGGQRVDVAVVDGAVVVASAATGLHTVTARAEIALPAAARQLCDITVPGPPVLVAASPAQGVLVVHPARILARLLADHHARLAAGGGAGEEACDGG